MLGFKGDESLGVEETTSNGRSQNNLAVKKLLQAFTRNGRKCVQTNKPLPKLQKVYKPFQNSKPKPISLEANEKREERERQFRKKESERI